LISFLLLVKSIDTCLNLSIIPHTYSSHVYKLTIFVVVELFFFYILPTLKALCDLTSSCFFKASSSSHIEKKTQKKKKQYKWRGRKQEIEIKNGERERGIWKEEGGEKEGGRGG